MGLIFELLAIEGISNLFKLSSIWKVIYKLKLGLLPFYLNYF